MSQFCLPTKFWKNMGVIYNSVGTLYVSLVIVRVVSLRDAGGCWEKRRMAHQTSDNYFGYNGSVQLMSPMQMQQYRSHPKIIITSLSTSSFSKQSDDSQPISDLVVGNVLLLLSEEDAYYCVQYPDGRKAFVRKIDAQEMSVWLQNLNLTGENIVSTAYRFMGIPYLWGGTSAKGLDCSGFTKLVFFLNGFTLARDASQQVMYGKLVDESGRFEELQPGDLLFFGRKATVENPQERVLHVGIYIGDKRFIHASDNIHISSFDQADPLYDEMNTNRYLRAKRIIGELDNFFEYCAP